MWFEPNALEVKRINVLDETGKLTGEIPELSSERIVEMYKWMVLCRTFDQRALKLQRQGRNGTFAPVSGQEAAQIGSAMALSKQDWVFPSYRDVAVSMYHGVPMKNIFLYTKGHFKGLDFPADVNVFPIQIIIGAQLLHAVGSAWASRYKDEDSVSVAYIGDGGTSEGDFHEALNMAGVLKLPTIFFVQNNQWAISVPVSKQTASKSIAQKAMAYGISGVQVDGNDCLAVYKVMKEAVKRAKNGEPVLIEAVTYRQGPHTTADDPTKYRDIEEAEGWAKKDPLARMKTYLTENALWDEEKEAQWQEEASVTVSKALEEAENTPDCELAEVFDAVFEKAHPALQQQKDEVLYFSSGQKIIR